MNCPECETGQLEPMGYGDLMCPECKHVEYAESEADFNKRIWNETEEEFQQRKAEDEAEGKEPDDLTH